MDLMSPSKDVSNARIPYVYLVAVSFLLQQGTLDDWRGVVERYKRLSGRNIARSYQSAGAACVQSKLARVPSCPPTALPPEIRGWL